MSVIPPRRRHLSGLLLALALGAVLNLLSNRAHAASPASAPKDYRLFVGVDLLVPNGEAAPLSVESLHPHEVVVNRVDNPIIPLREVPAFTWSHATKIGRTPITISDFDTRQAVTIQNDKAIAQMSTQGGMVAYQQERQAFAEMKFYQRQRELQPVAALAIASANTDGGIIGAPTTAAMDGLQLEELTLLQEQMDSTSAGMDSTFYADRTQEGIVNPDFDAMDLTFSISSADPIADAYVVVMGSVVNDGKAGVVTFHQNIGPVGREKRRIKIRKTGFTPGYEIKEVKLHLYSRGKELGTNLSEKNLPLTRDQAREFLLLSHISEHAMETTIPAPVWTLAPTALLAAADGNPFNHPVIVNIDADGTVLSIHESEADARAYLAAIHDASELRSKATPGKASATFGDSVRVTTQDPDVALDQSGRLPAHVVAAMRDMIFVPALDRGTPVAGTAKVNLADYFK
ncbi:hypothetical protein [Synoicihabitans lomoniglobus]|uniref:Uncharacterized protein n=1 Tax=Synoicihabitans lomoniglobus TaxID=2909285 RepID=A0AAE9ZXM6_9BACT|nr:hypothetical protein [Opitutaceae bacterium LMO-M01]WED65169.1 hypothetical protein PXH66_22760 [Opitutaceae bacterium LMO-M01]